QMKVSQEPSFIIRREGESVTIRCRCTSSPINSLHWYKQQGQNRPHKVLVMVSTGTVQVNQFSASLDEKNKFAVLNISNSNTEDSMTYFCAVQAQCYKAT
ncbi:TVA2 protein, partial [Amia calva]|nr:TVA2 protein [Amia calva]